LTNNISDLGDVGWEMFAEIIVQKWVTASMDKGHAVAQLVEALRYKPERRGFDSRIVSVALWHWGRLSL
jgi:hypothetical protein